MDLTEIPIELKSNNNFNYLFNIKDHFSKFGISIPVINKEAKTILENLKIVLESMDSLKKLDLIMGKN